MSVGIVGPYKLVIFFGENLQNAAGEDSLGIEQLKVLADAEGGENEVNDCEDLFNR